VVEKQKSDTNVLEKRITGVRPIKVRKRLGEVVDFDITKISSAVYRAMVATLEGGSGEIVSLENDSQRIAESVVGDLRERSRTRGEKYIPSIEEIQNFVERNLIMSGLADTTKKYILYRNERTQIRNKKRDIPERIKNLVQESKKYFKDNPLGEFVYYRTYSRWGENEERRETWIETVDRYTNFMKKNLESRLGEDEYNKIKEAILNHKSLPSMRLLWSAGKAAENSNVTAYNCSYTAPTTLKDFGEIMYILMCGTGVGFSVESQFGQQLPIIKKQEGRKIPINFVEDSKEGWADALVKGLETWYNGQDIKFDYSKVRLAGARLKTMGGRSSGPGALTTLIDYARERILKNQGKRLLSLDVHDINCKIGEIVVVGGVRRSAEISLSDLEDTLMRDAKRGEFYNRHPERMLANNSAVYEEKPDNIKFMKEWLALAESGSGERGIFNRGGLITQLPERRRAVLGNRIYTMGTNPCAEINLLPKQFCNVTEVVARLYDTLDTLLKKVKVATILGTYQSMLTNFPYLSNEWKENCEEERLLGVSITGIMDSPILNDPKVLERLKQHAIEVNEHYAKRFGINPSTCITCIKPSGTASKIVNSSEGAHPRWAPYYIQHIRISGNDPLFHMLKDQKYPYYPEVGQNMTNATTFVLPFPIKSPAHTVSRKDMNAIDQLENWRRLKLHYTEHNPSVSVYVGDDEWINTAQWVYNNWHSVGGLSFFPRDDHVYQLAPKVEIDKKKYNEMVSKFPKIDYSQILLYEKEDQTIGAREYACVGGACDIK